MTIHAQVQGPWYPELDEHTFPDLDMLISRTKSKKRSLSSATPHLAHPGPPDGVASHAGCVG